MKKFAEITCSHPTNMTWETYQKGLKDVIYSLESDTNKDDFDESVDWKRVDRGFRFMGKHWRSFWV